LLARIAVVIARWADYGGCLKPCTRRTIAHRLFCPIAGTGKAGVGITETSVAKFVAFFTSE